MPNQAAGSSGRRMFAAAATLALLMPPGVADAQRAPKHGRVAAPAVLYGFALDNLTGAPLDRVSVSVAGTPVELTADPRGRFLVSLSSGMHITVTLMRLGYSPLTRLIEVPDADTARVDFFLVPVAASLDTVTVGALAPAQIVSARLAGFEQRRKRDLGGTFLTRDYIEKHESGAVIDLLRSVPGLAIVDSAGTPMVASTRSQQATRRGGVSELRPCFMMIGVDGQVNQWRFNLAEIVPTDIHGIEVYSGAATIPREFLGFRPDSNCGLVMIWTRSR